jgi:hypothetical protein
MAQPLKTRRRQNRDWLAFAAVAKDGFAKCGFQAQLIAQCGGAEDIAWAIYRHHGESSLEWTEAEIPVLGGFRPGDLIKQGDGDRVRECLWRTP